MSETSIARNGHRVHSDTTLILPSPIIECGNLSVFFDLLSPSSTVLLMPLRRRESPDDIKIALAVQVTAQIADTAGPTILTATFLAATCTILGSVGSLLIPCEERGKPADYVQCRAQDLQEELLACLAACLSNCPHVSHVRHPARYRVPNEVVWHPASLADSPIRFQMGHWTYPQPQADPIIPYAQPAA